MEGPFSSSSLERGHSSKTTPLRPAPVVAPRSRMPDSRERLEPLGDDEEGGLHSAGESSRSGCVGFRVSVIPSDL